MLLCLTVSLSSISAMKFQVNKIKNESANSLEKEIDDELQIIERNLKKIKEELKNLDMKNGIKHINSVKTQNKNTLYAAYDILDELLKHKVHIRKNTLKHTLT